jgi:hypothetical protein
LAHVKTLLTTLALVVALESLVPSQSTGALVDAVFRFSVAGRPVQSGKVWLFYYGWASVNTYALGNIRDGLVNVRMSDDVVRDEIKPPSDWEMFAVVVEVPGVGWYRTPDLGDFVHDTVAALDRLGTVRVRQRVHAVDLSPPVKQKIRALNSDGTPRAGLRLRFEM